MQLEGCFCIFKLKCSTKYHTSGSQENQEIQARHFLKISVGGQATRNKKQIGFPFTLSWWPEPGGIRCLFWSDSELSADFLILCYCHLPLMAQSQDFFGLLKKYLLKPLALSPNPVPFLLQPHTFQLARCWPQTGRAQCQDTEVWSVSGAHGYLPLAPPLQGHRTRLTCTDRPLGLSHPHRTSSTFPSLSFFRTGLQQCDRTTRLRHSLSFVSWAVGS